MRICRVTWSFPTATTPGAGLVVYFPARLSWEPTMLIIPQLDSPKLDLPSNVRIVKVSAKRREIPGWVRETFYTDNISRARHLTSVFVLAIWQIIQQIPFLMGAMRAMWEFHPDITICTEVSTLPVGILAKFFTRSKLVVSLHNMSTLAFIEQSVVVRKLLSYADKLFVVSKPMKRRIQDWFPGEHVEWMPTGVDLDLFRDYGLRRKKQIVTVATLKWKKGYQFLLEAIPSILERHPDAIFVIVGDGPERSQILDAIASQGIRAHVKLLGSVSQEEIVEQLNLSSLFVLPSLYEGLPKALLEALACGVPVVATDACNATDIVEGAGRVVESANTMALASSISEILTSSNLWYAYHTSARCKVAEFAWTAIMEKEHRVLSSLFKQ